MKGGELNDRSAPTDVVADVAVDVVADAAVATWVSVIVTPKARYAGRQVLVAVLCIA